MAVLRRFRLRMSIAAALLLTSMLSLSASAGPMAPLANDCRIGVYRFIEGSVIDIGLADEGLRWRMLNGRTGIVTPRQGESWSKGGWTQDLDGHRLRFDRCPSDTIYFDGRRAERVTLAVQETRFSAQGEELVGRLVLPTTSGPFPLVVLVHGSEETSARDFYARQRLYPAHGIGVFVYDKRGTGRSGGAYTQDFHVLARDLVAAVREARRLAGLRVAALVLEGFSQGGWVAPLAATMTPVDRLVISYGLAVSPVAENKSQVLRELRAAGHGPDVLIPAGEVVDATATLMKSDFREGLDRYAAVRERYSKERWFADIHGEFSGQILRYPAWVLRKFGSVGNWFMDQGTSWEHEPLPVLRQLDVPTLWVLAGADVEAPPEETRAVLRMLQRQGKPITVLEFPNTDHGILEFTATSTGDRLHTRVAEGYLRAAIEFIRDGRLTEGPYGTAVRSDPPLPAKERDVPAT
jgi:uncharacterized protein